MQSNAFNLSIKFSEMENAANLDLIYINALPVSFQCKYLYIPLHNSPFLVVKEVFN